ncbi:hypothetical protein BLNAU_11102 [Blattamonas nauphoetae]|uniref:Uncharacterized protein n=1 Tax=Blattamonas nauphoetae TaxID=2049346 RepID=A0ABQ9XRM0_9EUKA|nr:hypothetical protein BLNAU_11102 [Blattamonas nauphoetae]
MTEIDKEPDPCSSTAHSYLSSFELPVSMDCSPFLNWDKEQLKPVDEQAVVFRSLVATLRLQPALDDTLEVKAVILLEYVDPRTQTSTDAFVRSLASSSDDSDLIPHLIKSLNPQSLSFVDAVDIHTNLMNVVRFSLWLAAPSGLEDLEIEDANEQQADHETILKQVLVPSENYIWHLCNNRFSIIDRDQSSEFMFLLATLLQICPSYQPTMEFVLHMPVFLTIPSCLAFFEADRSIKYFMWNMNPIQQGWNKTRGEELQRWKTVQRMLRMEGIEEVMEQKLQNDQNEYDGRRIVARSIEWTNLQGMNLPQRR